MTSRHVSRLEVKLRGGSEFNGSGPKVVLRFLEVVEKGILMLPGFQIICNEDKIIKTFIQVGFQVYKGLPGMEGTKVWDIHRYEGSPGVTCLTGPQYDSMRGPKVWKMPIPILGVPRYERSPGMRSDSRMNHNCGLGLRFAKGLLLILIQLMNQMKTWPMQLVKSELHVICLDHQPPQSSFKFGGLLRLLKIVLN